uniref:Uncharacterized protein n=1 Tax=Chrysemys picta bellii TaxID=8478 RepID=A0A8C3HCI6_CHRPI
QQLSSLTPAFAVHLSGTKYGCGIGGCGACTVMISTYEPTSKKIMHYPANSCLLPICLLHGSAVTTVEGVGSTKTRVHPIQERLAKCHGSQCGFCTPGMVMSMYALLRNHPDPSMEQITAALDGNLCRCTGYRPIIDTYKSFAGVGRKTNRSTFSKVSTNFECSISGSPTKARFSELLCSHLSTKRISQILHIVTAPLIISPSYPGSYLSHRAVPLPLPSRLSMGPIRAINTNKKDKLGVCPTFS